MEEGIWVDQGGQKRGLDGVRTPTKPLDCSRFAGESTSALNDFRGPHNMIQTYAGDLRVGDAVTHSIFSWS